MSEPPAYLFVYGTLQPGFTNAFAQFLHQNSQYVGPGTMRGRLYNIGQYPGAVHDPNSPVGVHGAIFNITDTPGLLTRLDAYEGVKNPPDATDEYVRVIVPVSFGVGEFRCWIYLYNRPVLDSQRIRIGHYGLS